MKQFGAGCHSVNIAEPPPFAHGMDDMNNVSFFFTTGPHLEDKKSLILSGLKIGLQETNNKVHNTSGVIASVYSIKPLQF